MKTLIGLYAYKKEGEHSNLIGKIEIGEGADYAYQIRLGSGTIVGFNHQDEVKVVEFGV